jgi:small subunit ribosomal protein S13
MAEEEKQTKENKHQQQKQEEVGLIRILGKDVRGDKKLSVGLTQIRGISWAFSNAICTYLKIDGDKKVQDTDTKDLAKIEAFMQNPQVPSFLKNRRNDFEDGQDKHLVGADLKLRHEFDIKRLKKIKSYRGVRHTLGQPVRGQRTKSHFRTNRKKSGAVGVRSKK